MIISWALSTLRDISRRRSNLPFLSPSARPSGRTQKYITSQSHRTTLPSSARSTLHPHSHLGITHLTAHKITLTTCGKLGGRLALPPLRQLHPSNSIAQVA